MSVTAFNRIRRENAEKAKIKEPKQLSPEDVLKNEVRDLVEKCKELNIAIPKEDKETYKKMKLEEKKTYLTELIEKGAQGQTNEDEDEDNNNDNE